MDWIRRLDWSFGWSAILLQIQILLIIMSQRIPWPHSHFSFTITKITVNLIKALQITFFYWERIGVTLCSHGTTGCWLHDHHHPSIHPPTHSFVHLLLRQRCAPPIIAARLGIHCLWARAVDLPSSSCLCGARNNRFRVQITGIIHDHQSAQI